MDNCSAHINATAIELLSEHHVKLITFPAHSSGIFQMLDLVFFGAVKHGKKRVAKDRRLPPMADHARRMYRAFEYAAVGHTIRGSFQHAGFTYEPVPGGAYTLGFDENKARESPAFREVWDIDFPIGMMSTRRRNVRWGFINPEGFAN
jgi:hypothetical protein